MMACDQYNIKSLELQHGPLLPSLTYFQTSKKDNTKKYDLLFPSYHAVLGKAWKNILLSHDFRWTACNTITIGSSFFGAYLRQRNNSPQKQLLNKNVLVVSQPFFFSMLPFLTEILDAHGAELLALGYKITIRPHPAEDIKVWERLKEKHAEILQVQDSRSIHIYEAFTDISIVVGAASTAIYESLSFGIPVIIPAVFEKYNLRNTFITYENTEQFMHSLTSPETYAEKANPEFLSFLQTEELVDFLKRNNFYEQD